MKRFEKRKKEKTKTSKMSKPKKSIVKIVAGISRGATDFDIEG